MVEMKPCPFCGKERTRVEGSLSLGYFVGCDECAAEGPSSSTPEGAIEKWNDRTSQAKVVRCKNCVWAARRVDGVVQCGISRLAHMADHYCADGVREVDE